MVVLDRDESFEQAFDGLFGRSVGVARRVLGDPTAAEDVAAEALARTFARWSKVRDLPWRDGWVLRVTINLAIDAARRADHPRSAPTRVDDPSDVVPVRLALVAALRRLPRRQREAVALRYLADLSEADVARSLGVTNGTVKTHIHRGIAALRNQFDEEEVRLAFGS